MIRLVRVVTTHQNPVSYTHLEDPMKVYANSLLSVGGVSLIFVLLCLLFLQPISNLLDYGDHPEFIAMMAVVVDVYKRQMLSSAMADVMYFVSNGYIVFMPDVHFTIGTPGQSSYDAVVSGTKYLIEQGIAHPGKIGLQGHSWSGFQTN